MHSQSPFLTAPVLSALAVALACVTLIAEFVVRSEGESASIARVIASDDQQEIELVDESDLSDVFQADLIKIVQDPSLAPLSYEKVMATTFFRRTEPAEKPALVAKIGERLTSRKRFREAIDVLSGLEPEQRIEHGVSFSYALAYRGTGNVEAAINAYAIHVAANPNHNPGYINYGILLAETGQHEEAIRVFERSADITSSSRKGKSYSLLGQSQAAIGAYEDAIKSFDKSIQYRPDSGPTWRRLASAKARAGSYPSEDVEADYARALALAPGSSVTMKDWAEYNFAFGRFETALSMFRDATDEAPNDFDILFARAVNLLASERPRAARNVVRDMANIEMSSDQELLLAALKEVSGIIRPPTIETRNKVCAARTGDERSSYLCALLQLETESPRMAAETAAALPETSIYTQPLNFALARYEYRDAEYESALARLDRLVEVNPQSSLFWLYKARAQAELGDLDGALPAFRQAQTLNPESRKITYELADHLMALEAFEQAEETLLAYMDMRPNDASVLMALARNYALTGDPEKAEDTLLELMSMSEDAEPETVEQLVAVQITLEKYTEALSNADNLLERDPANIAVRRLRIKALTELNRNAEADAERDRIRRLEPEARKDDATKTETASTAP